MIEFKILALLSPNGFDERFWKYAKETKTYMDAYEKTEGNKCKLMQTAISEIEIHRNMSIAESKIER